MVSDFCYNTEIFKCKFAIQTQLTQTRFVCSMSALHVECDGEYCDRVVCPFWASLYRSEEHVEKYIVKSDENGCE